MTNCTILGNFAGGLGGGVFSCGVFNSVIYYNVAPASSNYYSGTLTYCSTTPFRLGFGNITNEPLVVDLANGDFHLQSNSPCINSGNNAYVTAVTDFDGNPRISGGTVDIGAYEFQNPASVISYAWLQQYGLPTDGSADFVDTDHDGMNNWQEWKAGTSPTDPSSVLRILSVTNSALGNTIAWQSISGVTYYLQRIADLGQPFVAVQSNIYASSTLASFTDTNTSGSGPLFYRVGVQ